MLLEEVWGRAYPPLGKHWSGDFLLRKFLMSGPTLWFNSAVIVVQQSSERPMCSHTHTGQDSSSYPIQDFALYLTSHDFNDLC